MSRPNKSHWRGDSGETEREKRKRATEDNIKIK
jgi:hypothetical protein